MHLSDFPPHADAHDHGTSVALEQAILANSDRLASATGTGCHLDLGERGNVTL